MSGALLVVGGMAIGGVASVLRFRALNLIGAEQRNPLARWRRSRMALRILGVPSPTLAILPVKGPGGDFHRRLEELCRVALPRPADLPVVYWSYDERPTARALGSRHHPVVAVSLGLLRQQSEAPRLFDGVMLHELAHVRHRDPPVFAVLRSFVAAWPISAIVVGVTCLEDLLARADQPIYVALVLMVSILWAVTLTTAEIFMLRYAGFVFSLRELHADAAAARWLGDGSSFSATLSASYVDKNVLAGRLRSLLSLRLTHLSGGERLALLSQPIRLLMPKFRYLGASVATVALVQSSPFLTGYGNIGLILFLTLFSWSVSTTILSCAVAVLWFARRSGVRLGSARLAILAGALALAYQLPFFELSGFTDLLLAPVFGVSGTEIWDSNWARIASGVWSGVWVSTLVGAALFVVVVDRFAASSCFAHDAHGSRLPSPMIVVIATAAILHLFVVVLLRWESESSLPVIDALTQWAYANRAALPILTFATPLLILAVGRWRKTISD